MFIFQSVDSVVRKVGNEWEARATTFPMGLLWSMTPTERVTTSIRINQISCRYAMPWSSSTPLIFSDDTIYPL